MCFDERNDDGYTSGAMAASSNVTVIWLENDNSIMQAFAEPVPTDITCTCVENQTVTTFERPTFSPVIQYSLSSMT